MDWYFDVVMLIGTFCVIAIGMTIYARLNPTYPRLRRSAYVYTGVIPTITISCEDSPTKLSPKSSLSPADSAEEEERQSDRSESPVDSFEHEHQTNCSQSMRLSIPDLDDDFAEEGDQDSDHSGDVCTPVQLSAVDSAETNKDSSRITLTESSLEEKAERELSTSQVEKSAEEQADQYYLQSMSLSPAVNEKEEDEEEQEIEVKDDEEEEEDLYHTQTTGSSKLWPTFDDLSAASDSNKHGVSPQPFIDRIPLPSKVAHARACKIGISHTVEEPLFPFSEIVEEQHPSASSQFKKRLSQ